MNETSRSDKRSLPAGASIVGVASPAESDNVPIVVPESRSEERTLRSTGHDPALTGLRSDVHIPAELAQPAEYWIEPTRPHQHPFVPYRPPLIDAVDGERRGDAFCDFLETRRSVRFFSDAPVPQAMIEIAVHAANTAPSGAHQQPWTFVATNDPATKHAIRQAAEHEERAFYHERDVPAWHEALDHLETDENKAYLDVVPWIVVAFAQKHTPLPDGTLRKNYYVNESVGIACGFFIAALHTMGLSTLTHTPNPMTFLNQLLTGPRTNAPTSCSPSATRPATQKCPP